jgi:DHA1 family bicyclomycin/chloramphenicol resistance-like MFS transporter
MAFMSTTRETMSVAEIASLVALLTSLVAISIDAMLPALPEIGRTFNVIEQNDTQLVVGLFLLGNTFGQLLFGPLSDAFGRKPIVVIALILFLIGCVLSVTADSFVTLLFGRILQGVGASGPRTVSVSMVRDLYSGRSMARIMSIAMTIFIIVPIIAPALGQVIMFLAGWRYIFGVFIGVGMLGLVWVLIRQPETLAERNRRPLHLSNIVEGFVTVVRTRLVLGYALAMGTTFGSFVGFLNSVQQIFHETFGVGKLFPFLFGFMALFTAIALIYNTKIVMKSGMQKIVRMAMGTGSVISFFYFVLCITGHGFGLFGFMVWGALSFFCIGMCFGNLNALAMEPLGQMAGIGAAVVGFLASLVAILAGIPLGRAYDGTQLPLIAGFTVLGVIGLVFALWAERGSVKDSGGN